MTAKNTIKLLFKIVTMDISLTQWLKHKMALNHPKTVTPNKNSIKRPVKYVYKLTSNKAKSYERVR